MALNNSTENTPSTFHLLCLLSLSSHRLAKLAKTQLKDSLWVFYYVFLIYSIIHMPTNLLNKCWKQYVFTIILWRKTVLAGNINISLNFSLVDFGTLTISHSSDVSDFSKRKLWKISFLRPTERNFEICPNLAHDIISQGWSRIFIICCKFSNYNETILLGIHITN